jgi:PKD repeat protein
MNPARISRARRFVSLALFSLAILLLLNQSNGPVSLCAQGNCYATRQQAEAQVPNYISPRNCFVWNDCNVAPGQRGWRPIPGTGCAHWVAHQLGFTTGGATCYDGYLINVGPVVAAYGGTAIPLQCCQTGDLWDNGGHVGIVANNSDGRTARASVNQCGVHACPAVANFYDGQCHTNRALTCNLGTTRTICSDDGNSIVRQEYQGCWIERGRDPCQANQRCYRTGADECTYTAQCGCANDAACDDGNACTIDTCNTQTGQCERRPRDCGQSDRCTIRYCDSNSGCTSQPAPGCDHSDENVSSSCGQSPTPAPSGEGVPRVAVLFNGFAPQAASFINALKELNVAIQPDFSLDIASRFPLMVVPSGGLFGLENSTFLRARLEEYTRQGGALIVFDQQHGAEYGVLPGGGLGGYGWAEDNSCDYASLYIRNYDQVLSGFDKAILNSSVDGYFTTVPTDTDVLLWRAKNGQPAMVRYNYGEGTVIASTAYDDWGTSNWQTSADSNILNRDLLAWAMDPAVLPEFDPGALVSLPIAITNTSSLTATAVQLSLLAPGKTVARQETVSVTLAAGDAISLTFNTTATLPLGIWRVDYALLDDAGQTVQALQQAERFVVKNPHPLSAPLKEVAFSVNAPTERFVSGSNGEFTFTVYNNTSVTRTLQVRYGLPHHTWETGDSATYGNFSNLSHDVVVGPNSQEHFVHVFPMRTNDRLFAYLYEGGALKDQTWFQTLKIPPKANTTVGIARPEYGRGQTVEITSSVTNLVNLSVTLALNLRVVGPGETVVSNETRPLALSALQTQTETFSVVLPESAPNGSFRVQADVLHDNTRISGNVVNFVLPNSPAQFDVTLPASLPADASDLLHVAVTNTHAYLPVTGTLGLIVADPSGVTTTLAAQPYALAAGQAATLDFDVSGVPARHGKYDLDFSALDQYGQRRWRVTKPMSFWTGLEFDRRTYRVRETMGLTATLRNNGGWGAAPRITLAIPDLDWSDVRIVPLGIGETSILTYSLPLSTDLLAGYHDVDLAVELLTATNATARFLVPAPDVRASADSAVYVAGHSIPVTLTNIGGVDAVVSYTLKLRALDGQETWIGQDLEGVTVPANESVVIWSEDTPDYLASGDYVLVMSGQYAPGERSVSLNQPVTISGADVRASAGAGPFIAGQSLPVTFTNPGGVDAWITCWMDLELLDGTSFSLGDTQSNILVPAGQAIVVSGTVPIELASGEYFLRVGAWYTPGYRSADLLQRVTVSGAGVEARANRGPYLAGGALPVSLVNVGSVDAFVTYTLALRDDNSELFLGEDLNGLWVPAHMTVTVSGDIPQGARSGGYSLLVSGVYTPGNRPVSLARFVQVSGPTIEITARTDREMYLTADEITTTTRLNNTGTPLPQGDLELAILREQSPGMVWQIYDTENSPLSDNTVTAAAVDRLGRVWLAAGMNYMPSMASRGLAFMNGGGLMVNRLLPDMTTWQQIYLPYDLNWPSRVSGMADDDDGQMWFATDGGVAVLAADDSTWTTFRTDNSGLVSDWINAMTLDADGNAWFATYEGVSKLTPSGEWFTYTSSAENLISNYVYAVKADGNGNIWFGTDQGVSELTAAGEWLSFTTGNSGLLDNYVFDIAFDREGNVWLATGYGISVLSTEGSWTSYTTENSPLVSSWINTIAVDQQDRKWIGYYGYGVHVISADGETWKLYQAAPNEGYPDEQASTVEQGVLSSDVVNDIAVAPNGDVWLATGPAYMPGEEFSANDFSGNGGVTRAYQGWALEEQVLWTRYLTLSLSSPDSFVDVASLSAASLNATGRLILRAVLTSTTGQMLASDRYPFYVFSTTVGLTLNADRSLYRPEQELVAWGELVNHSALPLADQRITVTLDSNVVYTSDPFDLPAGQAYSYIVTTTTPPEEGPVSLAAFSPLAEVRQVVDVVAPVLDASLTAPAVAGREPFPVSVTVANNKDVPAVVEVAITDVATDTLVLAPWTAASVEGLLSITQDTVVVAQVTGDLNQTLTATVRFGEAAHATLSPNPVYPAGPVAAPYTFANTGLLPVSFDADITLRDGLGAILSTQTIPVDLPLGASQLGTLYLDNLAAGQYTLDYRTPFEIGSVPFTVIALDPAQLTAVAGAFDAAVIPVTATVTNPGFQPFDGQVTLRTDFSLSNAPVSNLSSGASVALALPVDVSAVAAGDHAAQLELLDPTGAVVDQATVTLTVPAAQLALTGLPTNLTLPVSATVTLAFSVTNRGGAAGQATLGLTFSDLVDEEQPLWLPGGQTGVVAFTFFVPPDLEAKTYAATYIFNGQPGQLLLTLEGVNIGVTPALDKTGYHEGETASLTLHIQEQANRPTLPLYARVHLNDYDELQPLSLTPLGSADLTFAVPVSFLRDQKVFYGIYDVGSDRSIHLNTLYLPRLNPDVSLLTDKQVYRPGETVVATVVTTSTGQLDVAAPGFTSTIALPGANTSFTFVLPAAMARGTYYIDFTPHNCNCANEGQTLWTLFDVDAPEVRVTSANLDNPVCEPGQANGLNLTVASDQPVTARFLTWFQRPDGSVLSGTDTIVNLAASPANLLSTPFTPVTDQNGTHRVQYRLVDPSDANVIHGAGAEACDVGQAIVLSAATDKLAYADGESVLATVTLYATQPVLGELAVSVDGALIYNQAVSLPGGLTPSQVSLGSSFASGQHELQAVLTQAGRTSTGKGRFDYATDLPDLVVQSPYIWNTGTLTRTAQIYVSNVGTSLATTTTVALYDGDPSAGRLLGVDTVHALAAGEGYTAYIAWSMAGQEGSTLTLYARVDPDNVVRERREDNNDSSTETRLPPKVEAGSDQTLNEGNVAHLVASSFTGPDALETYSATVQWEQFVPSTIPTIIPNGNTGVLSDSFTFTDDGQYTVRVEVCSADRICAFDTFNVTVMNVAPTVQAGPDQTVNRGEAISLTQTTFSDPGVFDTFIITIDWGDGTVEFGDSSVNNGLGTVSGSHVYTNTGVYTVMVIVADNNGAASNDTFQVTVVGNVAPTVDAGPDQTANEGSPVSFNGSFTDPDIGQTHTIEWSLGDGATASGTLTPTHTYADNPQGAFGSGVYTVVLTVTDSQGGVGYDTLAVTVNNVAPSVQAGPDQTTIKGTAVSFSGAFTDPGAADTHTIQWNWGDGATTSGTLVPTHVYTNSGVYTVTLVVTDDDGGVGSDTLRVTVNEATPALGCLHATDSLDLRDRTVVSATNVFGGHYFELGADAHVAGNVTVDGNAFLRSRARVDGDVTLAGTLQQQTGVVIGGILTQGADVTIAPVPTQSVSFGSVNLTVNNDQIAAWSPGSYRDGMVRARGSAVLSAGVYNFRALTIEPDAKLILDTSAGAITVNIAQALEFGDRSKISAGDSAAVSFYTNASGTVRVGTDVVFNGSIVAPYAQVQVFSRTALNGCLAARQIVIEPDTVLRPSLVAPSALYPIALHHSTVLSATVGQPLPDVFNGTGPGNFGWLTWTGANGEPVLVHSLTPPGDSNTYANPNDPNDHSVSVGDWVYGRPGVSNSKGMRNALDALKPLIITAPVWDMATGSGTNTRYHVVGCANIQITSYRLSGQDKISAIYWGEASCP